MERLADADDLGRVTGHHPLVEGAHVAEAQDVEPLAVLLEDAEQVGLRDELGHVAVSPTSTAYGSGMMRMKPGG